MTLHRDQLLSMLLMLDDSSTMALAVEHLPEVLQKYTEDMEFTASEKAELEQALVVIMQAKSMHLKTHESIETLNRLLFPDVKIRVR